MTQQGIWFTWDVFLEDMPPHGVGVVPLVSGARSYLSNEHNMNLSDELVRAIPLAVLEYHRAQVFDPGVLSWMDRTRDMLIRVGYMFCCSPGGVVIFRGDKPVAQASDFEFGEYPEESDR